MSESSASTILQGFSNNRKVLQDFDWSAKLVFNCDTTVDSAQPIVQLFFHFVDSSTSVYEFTPNELTAFLSQLKKVAED